MQASNDGSSLTYATEGPGGMIAPNRPQRVNAVNEGMIRGLENFFQKRQNDLETKVLVLFGAGEK